MTVLEEDLQAFGLSCPIPLTPVDALAQRNRRRRRHRRALGVSLTVALVLVITGVAVAATRSSRTTLSTVAPPPTENPAGDAGCRPNPPSGGAISPLVATPNSRQAVRIIEDQLDINTSGGERACGVIESGGVIVGYTFTVTYTHAAPGFEATGGASQPTTDPTPQTTGPTTVSDILDLPAGYRGANNDEGPGQPLQIWVIRDGKERGVVAMITIMPQPRGPLPRPSAALIHRLDRLAIALVRDGPLQPS